MNCRKCKKEIPDGSVFCNHCGIKQTISTAKRQRVNGLGTVYKGKNGTWIADYTYGWDTSGDKPKRKRRRKYGFLTKKEALEYLPQLRQELPQVNTKIKFKDLYDKWLGIHMEKVTTSTINCYKSAYKYFSALYYSEVSQIRTEHLQHCIDECPHGTRTKENMKALCTSLFRYATQLDLVSKNYAEYIYIRHEKQAEKSAFSQEQLAILWKHVADVPSVVYILILCYTGMRLGEMLSAKTDQYNKAERYFITGSKTEAGKDRVITISPKIFSFFENFGKGKFLFFADNPPTEKKFRNDIFYPTLQQLGIDVVSDDGKHLFTPHCCRHTFATLMKNVDAPPTDKQKLIGHSSFEMTTHYTHTDLDSLRKITDSI